MIHLGAKELGWERDFYENVLWSLGRVRSAGDLDYVGRRAVIDHMRRCGFHPKRGKAVSSEWGWVDSAPEGKRKMLRKIIMLSRPRPKAYVDAMAKHMFHVERLEFAAEDQLHALIAALEIDARRRAASQERPS